MQTKQTGPAMTAANSTGPKLEGSFLGRGPRSGMGRHRRQIKITYQLYIQCLYMFVHLNKTEISLYGHISTQDSPFPQFSGKLTWYIKSAIQE